MERKSFTITDISDRKKCHFNFSYCGLYTNCRLDYWKTNAFINIFQEEKYMFCSKCGKTIDDNAPFCGFCGAPTGKSAETVTNGAPQATAPQPAAPQQAAPQQPSAFGFGAPQGTAPQYGAPQAPQYGAAGSSGSFMNLSPSITNWIKLGLLGVIGLMSLLVLIASITTLATTGAVFSGDIFKALKLPGAISFSRVTAIICFSFCVLGVVFTVLSKQQWKLMYMCGGIGVIMFVFNFILGAGLSSDGPAPLIVSSIFLLISASAMLSVIARAVVKNFIPKIK